MKERPNPSVTCGGVKQAKQVQILAMKKRAEVCWEARQKEERPRRRAEEQGRTAPDWTGGTVDEGDEARAGYSAPATGALEISSVRTSSGAFGNLPARQVAAGRTTEWNSGGCEVHEEWKLSVRG